MNEMEGGEWAFMEFPQNYVAKNNSLIVQ